MLVLDVGVTRGCVTEGDRLTSCLLEIKESDLDAKLPH